MLRGLIRSTLLILALLAAAARAEDEPPRVNFWFAPVPTLFSFGEWQMRARDELMFSTGVSFIRAGWEWNLSTRFWEATLTPTADVIDVVLAHWISLGPIFRFGGRPFEGFFLSPQLVLGVLYGVFPGPFGVDILAGFEVGYAWKLDHFCVTVTVGLNAGYASSRPGLIEDGLFVTKLPIRDNGFVLGLPTDLIRIGFSF